MNNNISILIPAYQPGDSLVLLVMELRKKGFSGNIIIVDDGSSKHHEHFFNILKEYDINLLRHDKNQGKGEALKSGFTFWLNKFSTYEVGIVTADADGQHKPEDILKIVETLKYHPFQLIIGQRNFNLCHIPTRSLIGNKLTRSILKLFSGLKIQDSQSGLRGIPTKLIESMVKSKKSGYEFELEMLFIAKEQKTAILEVEIETIYEQGNPSSHFNPIFDSMKIYFVLMRFCSISLLSALIDFSVFFIAFDLIHSIPVAVVLGRTISSIFNFTCNRKYAFLNQHNIFKSALKYYSLVFVLGFLAIYLISFFHYEFGIPISISKLISESLLFFASFLIQHYLIYSKQ